MDLTVVGGGVAGCALVLTARRRGLQVRHRDMNGSSVTASSAALAILRRTYTPQGYDPDVIMRRAIDLYTSQGCEIVAGAWVSSNRKPEGHMEQGWYAVQPERFLFRAEHLGEPVSPYWVDPESTWTIHATGAGAVPRGKATYGVTWVSTFPDALLAGNPLSVHHYAPYKSAEAVRYRSGARLGSSSAVSYASALAQADRIMTVAFEQGWVTDVSLWQQVWGVRVQVSPLFEMDAERGWARMSGFHRTGWLLAPTVAVNALDRMFSDSEAKG